MAPTFASKRRRVEEGMQGKIRPKKKVRKQRAYHSDSEDEEEAPIHLQPPPKKIEPKQAEHPDNDVHVDSDSDDDILNQEVESEGEESADEEAESRGGKSLLVSDSEGGDEDDVDEDEDEDEYESNSDSDDDETSHPKKQQRKLPKRSDPTAFSTSISKILSTKIPTSSRADPLLSRSRTTAQAASDLSNEKLEVRARAKLRAQRKEELEKGHVIDVLGVDRGDAGETAETEKKLRKVAQRGVIKLFNAVRVAQVRGEELAREERRSRSTVGMDERKKHVNEVSKQGFLELINGKGNKKISIEEA
ncbi:hypothetical protein KEM56_001236 [Ascosphaera pollenicola]|nr:hypothetical protein KEM56_001236 [Ascosphaera pollenicola]